MFPKLLIVLLIVSMAIKESTSGPTKSPGTAAAKGSAWEAPDGTGADKVSSTPGTDPNAGG